jgi:hypothetical protein
MRDKWPTISPSAWTSVAKLNISDSLFKPRYADQVRAKDVAVVHSFAHSFSASVAARKDSRQQSIFCGRCA